MVHAAYVEIALAYGQTEEQVLPPGDFSSIISNPCLRHALQSDLKLHFLTLMAYNCLGLCSKEETAKPSHLTILFSDFNIALSVTIWFPAGHCPGRHVNLLWTNCESFVWPTYMCCKHWVSGNNKVNHYFIELSDENATSVLITDKFGCSKIYLSLLLFYRQINNVNTKAMPCLGTLGN